MTDNMVSHRSKCQLSCTQLDSLKTELKKLEHLELAYLHGSAACGRMRPDSDIDLAFLFTRGKQPSALALLQLGTRLEDVLGFPIHIGLLDLANPVFAKEVISSGMVLLKKEGRWADEFAMYALSFYANLNDQRRPVLDAYGVKKANG